MESASTGKLHNFGCLPERCRSDRRNWQAFQTHPLTKIFMPWWKSSRAIFCEPSPPTVRTASMASFFESALAPSETSRTVSWPFLDGSLLEGITAIRGAQDSAVARQDTADVFERELARLLRPEQAVEAVGDANDFDSCLRMADLTTARRTALRPGASPPPVPMPMGRMSDTRTRVLSVVRFRTSDATRGCSGTEASPTPWPAANFKTARKRDG